MAFLRRLFDGITKPLNTSTEIINLTPKTSVEDEELFFDDEQEFHIDIQLLFLAKQRKWRDLNGT